LLVDKKALLTTYHWLLLCSEMIRCLFGDKQCMLLGGWTNAVLLLYLLYLSCILYCSWHIYCVLYH